MSDPVLEQLQALRDKLVTMADAVGEGPRTMRKSRFRSEIDRQAFAEAHGRRAYDRLEE